MKDMTGREIKVGDVIKVRSYTVQGGDVMRRATVLDIKDDHIIIGRKRKGVSRMFISKLIRTDLTLVVDDPDFKVTT